MKTFSLDEANRLIPRVRPRVERIQKLYRWVAAHRESAGQAAEAAEKGGGGMSEGPRYVASLMEISKHASHLDELGIQIKDYGRGLIDFPSFRDGRLVLLCWQLGEGDEIGWWHDLEAGFAGRRPL